MAIFNTSQIQTAGSGGTTSVKITPDIQNVTLTLADTEYSITLSLNAKALKLRARGTSKLQLAYNSGDSSLSYLTIFPGEVYEEDLLNGPALVIYIQASKAGEVIELLTWT